MTADPCFFLRLADSECRAVLVKLLEQHKFEVASPVSDSNLLLLSLKKDVEEREKSPHLQCFATEEALMAVPPNAHLFPVKVTAPNLMLLLQRGEIVTDWGLLHSREQRRHVWQEVKHSPMFLPTKSIRQYFGEEVAYYFAWMNFYTWWLFLPGVAALLLWAHSSYLFYTAPSGTFEADSVMVDRNPWVPFFALLVVLWAFLFNKLWTRRSNELAFEWGTWRGSLEEFSPAAEEMRATFWGEERTSPVTGLPELHYPTWRRRCKYVVSALVTAVMLSVAFFVMIASLNLQGVVDRRSRFGDDNVFYMSSVEHLRHPGAIFDSQGPFYKSLMPQILHSVVILILNQFVYKRIAIALTEWENHKTEDKFETSLVFKRFLFDAFDCYIALFYLAFYECDVDELRTALVGLYTSDSVRRLIIESIIPLVSYFFRGGRAVVEEAKNEILKKKTDQEGLSASSKEAVRDLLEDPYEIFDDYLEMVIQFGYITLFASAFPLAACISIASNWIELRSDAFKLTHAFRRPSVRRPHGIGIWAAIIKVMTWLAVITNVIIFAFSSEQMMQWFPFLFKHVMLIDTDGQKIMEQELKQGAGRYVLGLVLVLEHVLILLGLFIDAAVHNVPLHTRNELMKQEYRKAKLLAESREDDKLCS